MNALFLTDGYKTGHHMQYPENTEEVYSNLTARSNKHAPRGCEHVVSAGQQFLVRWLKEYFDENFFKRDKAEVCEEMQREMQMYLGAPYSILHFQQLHDLGYLPIEVKALPEGVEVPIRVPILTIKNTLSGFYWITNYLESIISATLWQVVTSATIALRYKRILTEFAVQTDSRSIEFVNFQGHDFSMRGMGGLSSVMMSGIGHAFSFSGSDSLPVIHAMRKYYDAKDFVIGSVNATEHSVMCAGTKRDELGTFKRLMEVHPEGILSIVSDTWDLWRVVTEFLPALKKEILKRDGKIVIRPDSGNPVDIICGTLPHHEYPHYDRISFEQAGVVELLWDVFGGTTNDQGYKVLDPHIGAIYGDSITPDVAGNMCARLAEKGFATTNVVLGIGSYTYQYNTRDTFGMAMKATSVVVDGERRDIFKDPVTDDGTKKSAKGLLKVSRISGAYRLIDQVSEDEEKQGELKTIFKDNVFYNQTTLEEVRGRMDEIL